MNTELFIRLYNQLGEAEQARIFWVIQFAKSSGMPSRWLAQYGALVDRLGMEKAFDAIQSNNGQFDGIIDGMSKAPTPPDADLLTLAQAAQEFGVSPRTIRRWIDAGEIKKIRLLRFVYVSRSELAERVKPRIETPQN